MQTDEDKDLQLVLIFIICCSFLIFFICYFRRFANVDDIDVKIQERNSLNCFPNDTAVSN